METHRLSDCAGALSQMSVWKRLMACGDCSSGEVSLVLRGTWRAGVA